MNLSDLFETLKANVFPEMLDSFAKSLGLTVESIKAIGVGFYPAEQAWVTAEYDEKGHIIGLLKRFADGKKNCFENSNRGLYYRTEAKKYGSLLEDFIRVSDAGVDCPICRKPDWCLVSRDCPDNPDQVICAPRPGVDRKDSVQIGDAGFLYVLHPENRGKQNLEPLRQPLLAVEGWSDVCAAYDLGFDAIGRPSAEGKLDLLAKKVKGLEVIIIGENDSGAGKTGMELTFGKLTKYCKVVTKIMPPTGIKDLREWLKTGVTHDEILSYVKTSGDTQIDPTLLSNPAPLGIASQWLLENYVENRALLLRHYKGDFYRFNKNCYNKINEDTLSQDLYKYLDNKWYIHPEKNKKVPYSPDEQKIRKIKHACLAQTHTEDETEPFILPDCPLPVSFKKESQIIFSNGVLDINTGKLSEASPYLFSTSTLPYAYDPVADCPIWKQAVEQWFGGDKKCELLLAQWFGYNMIATYKWEKLMILYGAPASGKSTTTGVLSSLMGPERCTAIDFNDISYTFGMSNLIGKYSAIMSEDQVTKRMDSGHILQTLKRLTGQNLISIKRKFKESYSMKLFARLTFETNELPRFVDNPQALRRRIMFLCYNNSFEDSPDVTLKDRLQQELPGIANWAIEGLKDLIKCGDFIEPTASTQAKHELKMMTSPLAAMIDDCCDLSKSDAYIPKELLYNLHKAWFNENGYSLYNRVWFTRSVNLALPKLRECRPIINGMQTACWQGVSVNQEALKIYLGCP
jgi:P4 family phage/plasmid primase-like protien